MDNLNTYKINLYEQGITIGEKLKYHRLNAGLTQNKLAEIIGLSKGACIKSIELNQNFISRSISKKLANFFSIGSNYFYDAYLEDTEKAAEVLKKYRLKNNLSINQSCKKFNISRTAWCSWENSSSYMSRESYSILKYHGVF